MSASVYSTSGVLRERYDDATRTYTAYDAQGVQTSTRAYTAAENAAADAAAAQQAAQADHDATTSRVRAIVVDLQAEKDRAQAVIDATNAAINTNPAGYVKDAARAAKRIADAAIDLAKYVDGK